MGYSKQYSLEELEKAASRVKCLVDDFFSQYKAAADDAVIKIEKERYIFINVDSFSFELQKHLLESFGSVSQRKIMYEIGRSVGIRDSIKFTKKWNLTDDLERLAAGPIYFASSGWGFVEFVKGTNIEVNENFVLAFNHYNSFEADSFILNDEKSKLPVCLLNSGYSAGWCSVAFNMDLRTEEIMCKAKGDDECFFLMAQTKHFEKQKMNYLKTYG